MQDGNLQFLPLCLHVQLRAMISNMLICRIKPPGPIRYSAGVHCIHRLGRNDLVTKYSFRVGRASMVTCIVGSTNQSVCIMAS